MRRDKDFELVLDASHFTDYRDQHQAYRVFAKLPDTVSFSVVILRSQSCQLTGRLGKLSKN